MIFVLGFGTKNLSSTFASKNLPIPFTLKFHFILLPLLFLSFILHEFILFFSFFVAFVFCLLLWVCKRLLFWGFAVPSDLVVDVDR